MSISYKWPTKVKLQTNPPGVQQALFVENRTKQQVQTTTQDTTMQLGIATVCMYFVTLFWIYGTSYARTSDFRPWTWLRSLLNWIAEMKFNGKVYGVSDALNKLTTDEYTVLHTLSDSFQHCSKPMTAIFAFTLIGLLTSLYLSQNFGDIEDSKRIIPIIANFLILLTWVLFFYIYPGRDAHIPIAFVCLAATLINAYLVMYLYVEYYTGDLIDSLTTLSWVIIGFSLFSAIVMIASNTTNNRWNGFEWTKKRAEGIKVGTGWFQSKDWVEWRKIMLIKFNIGTQLIAISEALVLIAFGAFLIIVTQMPPLPPADSLECTITPGTNIGVTSGVGS